VEDGYRRYEYLYVTEAFFSPSVSYHFFKMRVVPCMNSMQLVEKRNLCIEPSCMVHWAKDGFGNEVQYGSYSLSHDKFRIESSGVVKCGPYILSELQPNPIYLAPSLHTYYDYSFSHWVRSFLTTDMDSVAMSIAIMHNVHNYLNYKKFSTSNTTCAMDVFYSREGVCQDFSHVMIAACRCAGLYARYVNGLVLGEGETHAWVEVYDGSCWKGYDPTRDCCVTWGYVKIAHGRDVGDCPSNRGQIYGNTQELLNIQTVLKEL